VRKLVLRFRYRGPDDPPIEPAIRPGDPPGYVVGVVWSDGVGPLEATGATLTLALQAMVDRLTADEEWGIRRALQPPEMDAGEVGKALQEMLLDMLMCNMWGQEMWESLTQEIRDQMAARCTAAVQWMVRPWLTPEDAGQIPAELPENEKP